MEVLALTIAKMSDSHKIVFSGFMIAAIGRIAVVFRKAWKRVSQGLIPITWITKRNFLSFPINNFTFDFTDTTSPATYISSLQAYCEIDK